MGGSRKKPTLLTNRELEVMQVVWESGGPVSVRDVVERINRGRPEALAYNTVQTMLTILKDKGVVQVLRGTGRAHSFRARQSREEVTTHMVGDLVDRLFGGEVQPLLVHLMEQERLSRGDMQELRQLVERHLDDEEPAS